MNTELEQKNYNQLKDQLHGLLRKASVSEENKPIVFAGCILAVKDTKFLNNVINFSVEQLADEVLLAIERVIDTRKLFNQNLARKQAFMEPFKIIKNHKSLHVLLDNDDTYLAQIIALITSSTIIKDNRTKDIIADFYTEFLRWSGGDGSGLGIVLTPKHITELFAEAGIALMDSEKKESIVFDNSFGGGSFLRSGATHKEKIVGVELNPKMFSLGTTSLILQDSNISNLFEGDCFSKEIETELNNIPEKEKPTLALINPPYSLRKNGGKSEIEFIEQACNVVKKGYVFALVPISTGAGVDAHSIEVKKRILANHSLYAVMSMPTDLFIAKAGTMVQILVFKTGVPHSETTKTWFADWSDDGFVLQKHVGREDYNGVWESRKNDWVKSLLSRENISGSSVLAVVGAGDTWATEQFLGKNANNLTTNAFANRLMELETYKQKRNQKDLPELSITKNKTLWKEIELTSLFKIKKGDYSVRKTDRKQGNIPLVSASAENNGVSDYVENTTGTLFPTGSLTIAQNGSVGATFLQIEPFVASSDVAVLKWVGEDFRSDEEQQNILLFIATVLEEITRTRFHYGFKLNNQRLQALMIPLPFKNNTLDLDGIQAFMSKLS